MKQHVHVLLYLKHSVIHRTAQVTSLSQHKYTTFTHTIKVKNSSRSRKDAEEQWPPFDMNKMFFFEL